MSTRFTEPAKKHLGQNFLHDNSVIAKIVQAVNPQPGDHIVEIGPGQGALTFPLLQKHGELTAIEFDRDLHAPLQAAARAHGTLHLIEGDVLGVDFTALAAVRDMHFMLQKEVVERMAAGPGNKVYGRLTVMLQAYCAVTPLFIVPPGAFRPAPKVESAVVRLVPKPRDAIEVADHRVFANVVRAAFGQRRKTLRNALNGVAEGIHIEAAGLRPDARAEQVEVAGFVRLANLLAAR